MQGLPCSFRHICCFGFLLSLALPSVFNNSKIIIFNFRRNKMPQVLIHASLVSSSALSVLSMDHCLTLHPFSLASLVFWHDLIHLIGLEIMATVWFLSKPRPQGELPELVHPNLDPRNIAVFPNCALNFGSEQLIFSAIEIPPLLITPSSYFANGNSTFCRGIIDTVYSVPSAAELTPFIEWLPQSAPNDISH